MLISIDNSIANIIKQKLIYINYAVSDIFRERDPDKTNTATFTMEEWIEKTLYS